MVFGGMCHKVPIPDAPCNSKIIIDGEYFTTGFVTWIITLARCSSHINDFETALLKIHPKKALDSNLRM